MPEVTQGTPAAPPARERTVAEILAEGIATGADGRKRGALLALLEEREQTRSYLRDLLREADLNADRSRDKRPAGRAIAEYVDEIVAFAGRPRLSLCFGEVDAVAPWPVQSIATLIGPSGTGKTSYATQVSQFHARKFGPVLFLSAELAGVLTAARVVSQNHPTASWLDALDGKVPRPEIVRALDGQDIVLVEQVGPEWVAQTVRWLSHWRKTRPQATPLVVLDYLQILPCEQARDDGDRVKYAMRSASDELAKRFDCGVLAIAKPSRAATRMLRSGESIGADTAESGAESNAIEFYSAVQLALGNMREADTGGWQPVDLSISKSRFRGGDHVVPLEYNGWHGTFRAAGAAKTAQEVRREREAGKSDEKTRDRRARVLGALAEARSAGLALPELKTKVGRGATKVELRDLLRELVSEGTVSMDGAGYGVRYTLVDRGPRKFDGER